MGRCQSIEDFSIVGEFDVTQIYCSKGAYDAAVELDERALKCEELEKEFFKDASCLIGFVNIESLRAHQIHLRRDQEFKQCDIFAVAETWLYPGEHIEMPSNASHLLSNGRGGLASFSKGHSKMMETIQKDDYSMMKMELDNKNFIFVYISKTANSSEYIHDIDALLKNTSNSPTALIGDVNWHFAQQSQHPMKKFMQDNKFEQLIEKPTHIGGNIIDHVYVNPQMKDLNVQTLQKPVPYSDHYALYLKINQ